MVATDLDRFIEFLIEAKSDDGATWIEIEYDFYGLIGDLFWYFIGVDLINFSLAVIYSHIKYRST